MNFLRHISFFLAVIVVSAQSHAQQAEVPIKTNLCEIKAHPEDFIHKLVQFTAIASHGFEDSMVEDNNCRWPKDGPGVWMEFGGKRSSDTMYCCGFSPKPTRNEALTVEGINLELTEDDKFRQFDRQLHLPPKKPDESRIVRATLRGRIFTQYQGLAGTQIRRDWRGYGHMSCCMLFVLTQVVQISQHTEFPTIKEQSVFSADRDITPIVNRIPVPVNVREILANDGLVLQTLSAEKLSAAQLPPAWFQAARIHLSASTSGDLIVMGDKSLRGANANTFWVFQRDSDGYHQVLSCSALSLQIKDTKHHGYRDIYCTKTSGGKVYTGEFHYDGNKYVLAKDTAEEIK